MTRPTLRQRWQPWQLEGSDAAVGVRSCNVNCFNCRLNIKAGVVIMSALIRMPAWARLPGSCGATGGWVEVESVLPRYVCRFMWNCGLLAHLDSCLRKQSQTLVGTGIAGRFLSSCPSAYEHAPSLRCMLHLDIAHAPSACSVRVKAGAAPAAAASWPLLSCRGSEHT